MNPPLGPAKCDYQLFPNEMVERAAADASGLAVSKYYWDFHFNILLVIPEMHLFSRTDGK